MMKNRLSGLWIALSLIAAASPAFARRAAPPEIVWGKSSNAKFEYKVQTRTGEVTVFRAGDKENALWQVVVPAFGTFFSKIVLADSGAYLLHVRGNHEVWKVTDTGIHVATKAGAIFELKANEFIDALVPTEQPSSIDPAKKWLTSVEQATAASFTVINAKGEKKTVLLKDLKTPIRQPTTAPAKK